MRKSWRAECPIGLDELRLVSVTHWTFDGGTLQGELVVHESHAVAITVAFADLFQAQFPIAQMRLVDEYDGDDDRSMAANNTSAFNCRSVSGTSRWSEHAYGNAVDINPVQNPYVTGRGDVHPPGGTSHTDRHRSTPGLITADGPVVAAFKRIGWKWGGLWTSGRDYQHFSASGR